MRLLILAASLAAATAAFAQAPQTQSSTPAPRTPPAASSTATTTAPAARGQLMDINSASPTELATLKGIGEARAAAIVKGRPYKGKDDLVSKKIISKSVYDGIKDQIIARQK